MRFTAEQREILKKHNCEIFENDFGSEMARVPQCVSDRNSKRYLNEIVTIDPLEMIGHRVLSNRGGYSDTFSKAESICLEMWG